MGLVFKQIYSGFPSSILDVCMPDGSEAPPTASNGARWMAGVGSSTAGTGRTLTLDGGTVDGRNQATVQCLTQWESIPTYYGSPMETTTWEAGEWICRFSVSSANSAIYWDKVQICAVQGGVYTTIATKTGINTFLSATGTKSTTITTTEASTVTKGSTIWWGFHFGKAETLSAETIGIRSNKNLATPIENKRAVTVVSFASSPVLPGTTFGAINVSAPTTTFASAEAVPATTFGTLSAPVPVASITSAALAPTRLILIPYTPRGIVTSGAPEAATPCMSAVASRGVASSSGVEAYAVCSGLTQRQSAVSSATEGAAAVSGGPQRGQVSTAALGRDTVVTGISERSATAQGGIEVASISSAMIERGILASGGPEAFSG